MWHLNPLDYHTAFVVAAVLGAVGLLLARTGRRALSAVGVASREGALVVALFALWQVAGSVSLTGAQRAFWRGDRVYHLERWLHLPDEAAMQRMTLHHPLLVEVANIFYFYVHFNSMLVFLVWLFWRHRDRYPWGRNVVVLLTAGCLLVQLAPVAPPRLLPQLGFVDTGVLYNQTIYGSRTATIADQLSAMPSVHIGWAVLIAVVVCTVSRSRWRWAVIAHPVLTTWVVVVTGNHWWLDGVVACVILGLGIAVLPALSAAGRRIAVFVSLEPLRKTAPAVDVPAQRTARETVGVED